MYTRARRIRLAAVQSSANSLTFPSISHREGHSNRGIWVYIPPKSVQVNFLWGKIDVRMAVIVLSFIPPQKFIPSPPKKKQISGYASAHCINTY